MLLQECLAVKLRVHRRQGFQASPVVFVIIMADRWSDIITGCKCVPRAPLLLLKVRVTRNRDLVEATPLIRVT